MDEYLSEKEQIEEIKRWWNENGNYVIAGLVLGVAILVGWNTWKSSKTRTAESASQVYTEMMLAVSEQDREQALVLTEQLRAEYASTPYVDQALLALAKYYVDEGEHEEAAARLQELVESTRDDPLRKVARVRLARVFLELGQADKVFSTLSDEPGEQFAGLYHEILGDAHVQAGNFEAAASAYQNALDATGPGLGDRNLIEMKLGDLPSTDIVPTPEDQS